MLDSRTQLSSIKDITRSRESCAELGERGRGVGGEQATYIPAAREDVELAWLPRVIIVIIDECCTSDVVVLP